MAKTLRNFVITCTLAAQVIATSPTAVAQKTSSPKVASPRAQQAKLTAVHVVGSKNVTEEDVVAYTGLKIGDVLGPQQFREAADKLGASGAFDEVGYKYEPAGQGYSLTFTLPESQQLAPVTFDNFVWFTDAELTEHIRKSVPLFHGAVPTNGEMLQQVTDALQALITSRGVDATVAFEQEGSGDNAPGEATTKGIFAVDGVDFKVANVIFSGAAPADEPELQQASRDIINAAYHKKTVRAWAETSIPPLYAERGLLRAKIGDISTQLLNPDAKVPQVAISITVEPGPQYSLADVRWTGVRSLPVETLQTLVTVKIGAVANAKQLAADIDRVKAAYGRKGYLRSELDSRPSFNDAARTVAYDVQVREGDVYRLKSIDLDGLDAPTMARLREEWKLRAGEPFDSDYEREYMQTIRSMLPPNVSVSVDKELDDEAKTVEVSMHFITHATR